MQEFLIIFSAIIAFFFLIIGVSKSNWALLSMAGLFFLIISVGILGTGWERFEGNVIIDDFNSTRTVITQVSTTYDPILLENPSVYSFGVLSLVVALGIGFIGFREKNVSSAEGKDSDI